MSRFGGLISQLGSRPTHDVDAVTDRREELIRVGRVARRMRWFAVLFASAQLMLYQPPDGTSIPFDRAAVGALVVGVILSINLASMASSSIKNVRLLGWASTAELVADTAVAVGVVWLFSFDTTSALWALLIIPILEGAIRARLTGALLTWGGVAIAYIARDLWAASVFPVAEFQIPSVTYRMGILLIVAIATGYLAAGLEARMIGQALAKKESDRRAELLRIVATAGRSMATPDLERVFGTVVDSCIEIGFDGSIIALLNEQTETWRAAASRGLPDEFVAKVRPSTEGLIAMVRERRDTIVLDDYPAWEGARTDSRALGFKGVVACPIWAAGEIEAALAAGSRDDPMPSRNEIESLELLAMQAGAAITNAKRYHERRTFEAQLEHRQFYDSLTGLPNRSLFLDRLSHCLDRKATAPSPTAVLFVDIDRFKKVNDSYGHDGGDELLRVIGSRLQKDRAPADTVARFGDDEFTVLIEEPENEQTALESAQQIVDGIRQPCLIGGREVVVTASVGVAYGRQRGSARDFLREADLAMHRAKEQGGSRLETFRPQMSARAEQRMQLEFELRRAIDNDELTVHYQPVMAIQTGRTIGLEALVRWNHPTRGVIRAADFIPVAEEAGMIIAIGERVLESVCKQLSEWRAELPDGPHLPVSVNLSPEEFRQEDFVDRLVECVEEHGLRPADVVLEITESVVIRDDQATLAQMGKLQRYGVRMAVDDFGRGYSSLIYLKRFPFTILKVDKSFVAGITTSPQDQAIVRYVLNLAKDLGIRVVAEGVETADQLEYLRGLGCEYVQGFHLCKPLEATAVPEFVAKSQAAPLPA